MQFAQCHIRVSQFMANPWTRDCQMVGSKVIFFIPKKEGKIARFKITNLYPLIGVPVQAPILLLLDVPITNTFDAGKLRFAKPFAWIGIPGKGGKFQFAFICGIFYRTAVISLELQFTVRIIELCTPFHHQNKILH